jgi:hypothetical protein
VDVIKVVRFFPDALVRLPRGPALGLLAQVIARPGVHGTDLAEWWIAIRARYSFCGVLHRLAADGWIAMPDRGWQPTPQALAACIVLVDDPPVRQPDDDDQAWAARLGDWMIEPPQHVLQ